MDLTPITRRRRPLHDGEAGGVRRLPWQLLLVAALAFILGWAASQVWPGTAPLRLTEQLSGTVSVVNQDAAKLCLELAGGGHQRCGVAYQRRDAPGLRVGDRVVVGVGRLRVGDATEEEIMVIASVQ